MILFRSNPVNLSFAKSPHEMSTFEINLELGHRMESGKILKNRSNQREILVNELELHQLEIEIQNRQLLDSLRVVETSNKKYVDLYDYSPVCYLTLDTKARISNVNLTTAKMFGREKGSFIGQNFNSFVSKEFKRDFLKHVNDCLKLEVGGKISCEIEISVGIKDLVPVQLHSILQINPEGERVINMCIVDQSETKRADQAESVVDKLCSERSLRENFISTLSHDIRTPLMSTKLCAEMLGGKLVDIDKRKRLHELMIEELGRADQMIKDLLDANKMRGGENLPLVARKCDLGKIALKCVDRFNEVHHLKLNILLRAEGNLIGYWSRDALIRIMDNLISNAIKYGSLDHPITLAVEDHQESVMIIVHNYGDPIPAKEQKKIFQAFHRTQEAISGDESGWGLGLNLVRTLTLRHDGKISVKSNHADGTSFIIKLPKKAKALEK